MFEMKSAGNAMTPKALGPFRIVTAYLFTLHGTAKLLALPHVAMFDNFHLLSLHGLAALLEVIGGPAILLGIAVRPVALLPSGEMVFAYFIEHAPRGAFFTPLLNGGEAAVLFCFSFLFFSAAGGAWAIDNLKRVQLENGGALERG